MSELPSTSEPADQRSAGRRWRAFTAVAVAVAVVLGVRGARFLTPDCARDGCPELGALRNYSPPEPPQLYDKDGNLVGRLPGPKRIVVALEEIPEVVRDGYVAVEDRRFRSHGGVDLISALRAFAMNLRSGAIAEGGSTITMQLARNLFEADVARWNPFRRKLAEIRLSRLLEEQLSKDEILELYLNQIYLGDGVYGVETASRHYFGKPVARVGTREAALLIGLAKNPEGYNPRQNLEAANKRIATVLDVLVREDVVSLEEAQRARAHRLELSRDGSLPAWGKNAYYLSAVRRELHKIIRDPAKRPGLRVFTGLDPRAQAAAVDALLAQLRAIESGRWGKYRHPVPDGPLQPMDASPYLQGMIVAMDPGTGLVTTLVGGRDFHHSEFDRAFQAKRQPGSTFKPIVFAVALESGLRLSDRISTAPIPPSRNGSRRWKPSDPVTMPAVSVRTALVESSSRAAIRIGESVGVERVANQARRLGVTTEIPPYPSVFLGSAEVIPAELVAAFAAFGNGGRRVEPHLITRVVDPDGVEIYRAPERRPRVLDERVAFLVLDVLRDIVRVGTGWRVAASKLTFPAAGKTGTTDNSRDAWFVGLTPSLVAGVWLGFDRPKTIVNGGWGGNIAAPLWASFMRAAQVGRRAVTSWEPPAGVESIEIDALTGLQATPECPAGSVRSELFLRGAGPSSDCSQLASRPPRTRRDPSSSPDRRGPAERQGLAAQERPPRRPSRATVRERQPRGSNEPSTSATGWKPLARDRGSVPVAPPDTPQAPTAPWDTTRFPAPGAPTDTPKSRPAPGLRPPSPDTLPPRPDSGESGSGNGSPPAARGTGAPWAPANPPPSPRRPSPDTSGPSRGG